MIYSFICAGCCFEVVECLFDVLHFLRVLSVSILVLKFLFLFIVELTESEFICQSEEEEEECFFECEKELLDSIELSRSINVLCNFLVAMLFLLMILYYSL